MTMSDPQTPDGPRQTRRLCGVLLADMTNFSRVMGEDESRAISSISHIRDVFRDIVPRRHGTLEVQVGDCFVALFDSAVDAVEASVAIQRRLASISGPAAEPIRIRIGLHLGEVVRDGTEVFGDSINIAARLQTIARPGGITLSDDVYRAVRSRVDVVFRDLGMKQLKNIRDKMRVYEIVLQEAAVAASSAPTRPLPAPPRLALVIAAGLAALGVLGVAAYQLAIRRPPTGSTPPVPPPAVIATPAAPAGPRPTAEAPVVVGVMTIAARGQVPEWMRDVTRDGLNTILSRVTGLRVYSRQKIDFLRDKQGLTELEAAEKLGIGKMISGALAMDGEDLSLELQVVDIASGLLDASENVSGKPTQLIELQNQLAVNVLRALNIALSPDERTMLFAKRTNDTLDSYRMLADTLGGGAPKDAPAGKTPPPSAPPVDSGRSWLSFASTAWAADPDEEAIRAVLAEWAAALQAKDINRVAAVSLAMDDAQKTALTRYFENADKLAIAIADVDVLVAGDEALATFTRKDSFVDKRSGRDMQLEVRLSSELARDGARWKMKGIKKG